MHSYELFYDGNLITEDNGFESFEEAIGEAWEAIKERFELWEDDCELEEFKVVIIDEDDAVEYAGNEVKELNEIYNK